MKRTEKAKRRLAARIESFNSRGTGKIADGMKRPGSQRRKK